MIQLVVGTGVQFALASLVVSKMRRAKSHSQTILFSNTVSCVGCASELLYSVCMCGKVTSALDA